MTNIDVPLLREALRTQPAEDEAAPMDLTIEKMGDPAFVWLANEIKDGGLTVQETVRALRLLSRLSRQFCLERKGELLDIAAGLAENATVHRDARSVGAHIAIGSVLVARGLRDPSRVYGRSVSDIYTRAREVACRALELGLTPQVEAFARQFLAATRDIP